MLAAGRPGGVDPRRVGPVVYDAIGNPLCWQGVMLDVTERKHAEDAAPSRPRNGTGRWSSTSRRSSTVSRPRRSGEVLHQPPGRGALRLHPRGLDLDAATSGATGSTPTTGRSCTTPTTESNETKEPYTLDYRFRHADGHMDLGARRGHVRGRARRRRASGRDSWSTSPSGSGPRNGSREAELKFRTIVEQNQAIFYTQEIDPDDPAISFTTYIAPGNTDLIGYTLEEIAGRSDPLAIDHPSGGPGAGALGATPRATSPGTATSRWSTG